MILGLGEGGYGSLTAGLYINAPGIGFMGSNLISFQALATGKNTHTHTFRSQGLELREVWGWILAHLHHRHEGCRAFPQPLPLPWRFGPTSAGVRVRLWSAWELSRLRGIREG